VKRHECKELDGFLWKGEALQSEEMQAKRKAVTMETWDAFIATRASTGLIAAGRRDEEREKGLRD
jgi:hypothetical protein